MRSWRKNFRKTTLSLEVVYLLDVNVALALLDQSHQHHAVILQWSLTPDLKWALCTLTEAGVVRYFTGVSTGRMRMESVNAMLAEMQRSPSYSFVPITTDWLTLIKPFAKRLHGHKQVTDAILLGLAIQEGMILATMDKGILHLAGEHRRQILLLQAS